MYLESISFWIAETEIRAKVMVPLGQPLTPHIKMGFAKTQSALLCQYNGRGWGQRVLSPHKIALSSIRDSQQWKYWVKILFPCSEGLCQWKWSQAKQESNCRVGSWPYPTEHQKKWPRWQSRKRCQDLVIINLWLAQTFWRKENPTYSYFRNASGIVPHEIS